MSPAILILIIFGVLGLILIGAFIGIYNGLVGKRVETQNAWSQIDVQLKRRYDLIPNLVETVKGYAGHEKETLERVIQRGYGSGSWGWLTAYHEGIAV